MKYKIELTPYAMTFYNDWKLNPNNYNYNMLVMQTLVGELDIDRLDDVLDKLLLMNSHIDYGNDKAYWVPNQFKTQLSIITEEDILNFIKQLFNLEEGPLYRFGLVHKDKDIYTLIIIYHHILVDGSSGNSLIDCLSNNYNNSKNSNELPLNEQINLLTDLSAKLSNNLTANAQDYKSFWKKTLAEVEPLTLSFLKLKSKSINKLISINSQPIKEIRFNFNIEIIKKFHILKRKLFITPYLFSQAILAFLLYRYSSQQKLAISYPIAIKEGVDLIYGAQVNTNIIPFDLQKANNIIDLLEQSKLYFKLVKNGYNYYPIEYITSKEGNLA